MADDRAYCTPRALGTGEARMTDLVERLREEVDRLSYNSLSHGCAACGVATNLADEAATALEAKDKELAALRESDSDKMRLLELQEIAYRNMKARAETAVRELTREREAFQRHEQTLRDNGINSHSEAVVLVDMLRRERDEARAAINTIDKILHTPTGNENAMRHFQRDFDA